MVLADIAVAPRPSQVRPAEEQYPSEPPPEVHRHPVQSWQHRLQFLSRQPWPLAGILALQTGLSLRLVWSNTAFNDEALYLWSGHWVIAHLLYATKIPRFQTYFSGAPLIYPVIGAIADSYGGLALARVLSLAFMLGTTVLCYLTGKRLFGPQAGLIGAALFAVLGPVQFLGALATYDPMALFCLALSSWLVVRSAGQVGGALGLIPAALVLAIGDAAKYATILWNPVVIALAGLAVGGDWRSAWPRAARMAGYTAAFLAVLLRIAGASYVQGLLVTTLSRPTSTAPAMAVFRDSALWIGILVLIAARSIVIAEGRRTRILAAVLAGAALLAPLEQARIHTTTALQKHVAFGAFFAAIAAGWVLAHAVQRSKYSRWRIVFGTLVALTVMGTLQGGWLAEGWPDSAPVLAAMKRAIAAAPGPVLSEQGVVVNYYLRLPPTRLTNTFAFTYQPPDGGPALTGIPAYLAALRNHYFTVVEIDGAYNRHLGVDRAVTAQVESEAGYRLVFKQPWSDHTGSGVYRVWQYQPDASASPRSGGPGGRG